MINFKRILLRNYHFSQIVFKNLSWMIFASFVGKLFKFFLMVFLARSFTPSGFGDINYLIVLSAFCFSLSEIGLSMMINREYHQENLPKERLISAGWMLKILLVISNGLFCFFALFFVPKSLFLPFIVFSLMNALDSLKGYKIALARVENNQQYEAVCFIVETFFTTIFAIGFVTYFKNITSLSLAYLVGSILSSIYIWRKTQWISRPFLQAKKSDVMYLFKKILPFIFSSFLTIALVSVDTIMIKWLLDSTSLGYFQAGLKITDTVLVFPALMITAVFPFISKKSRQTDELIHMGKSITSVLLMVSLPIIFGGVYLAPGLISSIFGTLYESSTLVFQWLLIGTFPVFLLSYLNGVLLVVHKESLSVMWSFVGFVLNVILNFLLIQTHGILGVALSTGISRGIQLIFVVFTIVFIFRHSMIHLGYLVKYLVMSILMVVALTCGSLYISHVVGLIVIGMFIYFLMLFLTRDRLLFKLKDSL